MADGPLIMNSLIFSHIIPPILAFIGVILIATGIMDRKNRYTLMGVALFLAAGMLPFLILPFILG